jgi:hypothetical protein
MAEADIRSLRGVAATLDPVRGAHTFELDRSITDAMPTLRDAVPGQRFQLRQHLSGRSLDDPPPKEQHVDATKHDVS